LGDVIDRWRLNLGWRPLDNDSQSLAIQSWFHVLESERVPAKAYNELFDRALKLRALRISQNQSVPDFGVELLLACWEGENGLRRELRQREIDAGRTLTANAPSKCPHCFGGGMRYKFDENGKTLGVSGKCDHTD
jgi:hypothetical protein